MNVVDVARCGRGETKCFLNLCQLIRTSMFLFVQASSNVAAKYLETNTPHLMFQGNGTTRDILGKGASLLDISNHLVVDHGHSS